MNPPSPASRPSRRAVLRGLGTAVALPWLGSLRLRGAQAADAAAPTRLAFLFVPNGVDQPGWAPPTDGALEQLSPLLEPLEPVKDEVLVLSGLTHDKARANGDGPGDHARSSACFLTGAQPRKTAGADIRAGISVDQVAARAVAAATPLPSLELGCEPARQSGNCDSGYSCAYSSSISWRTPQSPLGKEVDPRLAFDRLFAFGAEGASATAERRRTRRSVLDFVRGDARRLRGRLGGSDRHKLDEYLEALRRLERRVESATSGDPGEPLEGRPPAGVPADYREHVRLMLDLLVLAFRTDRTRVATFMFGNEGSGLSYGFLGVKEGHHGLSHHGGDATKIAKIRTINRFHVSQLSAFLQALRDIPEGEGTLLDASMIVYGAGIGDGNRHNHDNLPLLVAGRGGGTITPGRHVRYPAGTPACNLHLSLLDRMGASQTTFGDATGRLAGLA